MLLHAAPATTWRPAKVGSLHSASGNSLFLRSTSQQMIENVLVHPEFQWFCAVCKQHRRSNSPATLTLRRPWCRNVQQARTVSAQAGPVEVAMVANEAAFISGVAGTMVAMTLIVRLPAASPSPLCPSSFVPLLSLLSVLSVSLDPSPCPSASPCGPHYCRRCLWPKKLPSAPGSQRKCWPVRAQSKHDRSR